MATRFKTKYPGVFYREVRRIGKEGSERMFYVVFKKDGKLYEEKAGRQYADGMTAAKASRVRSDRIEGRRQSPKEIRQERKKQVWSFNTLWEEYKKQNPQVKGIKIDENRYDNYLKKPFGNKEPKDVLPLDVIRVRNKVLKNRSPQSAKLVLGLLRRIANFGRDAGLCKGLSFRFTRKNPAIMPMVDNEVTECLSPEEIARLLKACDEDAHPQAGDMQKLALFEGVRRSEMFRLRWDDIDFQHGIITIRGPKRGQTARKPLNKNGLSVLINHIRTGSPYVFPGRGGGQRTDISKAIRQIKKKAGLPKNFRPLHGLRHTYASLLASSGEVDLYTLSALLTHKDPTMTKRYAHLSDEALRRASNVIADSIPAGGKKIS
ncbi:MAG: tyrosine-type recombinase/integrase [Candidatus Hodarchaeales archaeon]|jgi:integrase